jgi:hypothetical protein
VFLSYSRQDAAFVRRLVAAFEAAGCDVFVDEDDIPAASAWREKIEDGIAGSDNIVFVLSPAFAASAECARELRHAIAKGKRLIPIARDACEGVPAQLAERNYVWFRDDDDFERAFAVLLAAVRTDLDVTHQHSRFVLRQVDWQAHGRSGAWLLRGAELRAAQRWLVRTSGLAEPRPTPELLQYLAASQRAAGRRRLLAVTAAGAGMLAIVSALWWRQRERTQSQARHVAAANERMRAEPLRAVDSVLMALDIGESADAEAALATARSIARERLANLRDEANLEGRPGLSFIGVMRWRKGAVYSRLRADGRFALIASARSEDGAAGGEGKAYLVDLDSLRTIELVDDRKPARRLEYVGFSADGNRVLVTRQFYLDVYDLAGKLESSSEQGRTAQPLHLAAGFFAGTWILVCDSERQMWLANAASKEVSRWVHSSRDGPAVLAEADRAGRRAVVAFESGRAILLEVADPHAPVPHGLEASHVTFATFHDASRRFLTADRSGRIDVWEVGAGAPRRIAAFDQAAPSGLAGFADDGERIVAVDESGAVRVWDVTTGALRLVRTR